MRRSKENYEFKDALELNNATYIDYLNRFKRIALSMFEWVNLPKSMDARYLEMCLFYNGQAALLKDPKYGFINTKAAANGYVNIYGLPTKINCFSYSYQSIRTLYTGLDPMLSEKQFEYQKNNECILVMKIDFQQLVHLNFLHIDFIMLIELVMLIFKLKKHQL